MKDNIFLFETNEMEEKVQKILRQTNYTEEEAREKLKENCFDEILIIKGYLGIKEKKTQEIKSINQEIFTQIRSKFNSIMNDYHNRINENESKKII